MKLDDLKAELSHQICHGPDNECTHCIAISQAVDYLAKNGYLAALTGDCGGGDVDWSGLDKILRGMRARNEQGSLELTNWIADNKALTADNAKRGSDDSKA